MAWTRTGLLLVSVGLLSGCGTIMHGPRQNIDVQSSPSGAKIETSAGVGTSTTPTTLNLERKNSYVLTFTSPGYSPATFNIRNGIGVGTVIADVLLTGLVGVVVDGLTGSWYGLSPESAIVTLTKAVSSTGEGTGPAEIHVRVGRLHDGAGVAVTSDALLPVQVRVERR